MGPTSDYDQRLDEPTDQGPPHHERCDRRRGVRGGVRNGEHQRPQFDTTPHDGRGAVLQRCSGCHTLSYAAHARLGDERPHPRDRQRPELQRALRAARGPRALRDRERRLLGRDHAPEHRRRAASARRREVRRDLRRTSGAEDPGRDPCAPAADRHAPGHSPTATTATTGTAASTTPRARPRSADAGKGAKAKKQELQLLVPWPARPRSGTILDIQLIRRDPDAVRAALARRGPEAAAAVDRVLELDERWRALPAELEELRAEQNRASQGRKGPPTPEEREQLAALSARGRALSDEENAVRAAARRRARGAAEPPVARRARRGRGPARGRRGRRHRPGPPRAGRRRGSTWSAAARTSGSRFAYLQGDLVMLELALVRYALEKLRGQGFEPVIPPVLVREQALYGTGFLPDTEQQIYRLADDDLYLVGTSEVPLASLHATRSSPATRCRSATPASRPASGARRARRARTRAGSSACTSSTRSRCSASSTPEEGQAEHERLLAIEESILQELEIPYRVVAIAVDDLGASAAKKYDCEAWLPGPGPLPRADLDLEHDRLPGPAAGHPLPARGGPAGARSTRSTGRPWRSGARSSRCWRTASRTTARCVCPRR